MTKAARIGPVAVIVAALAVLLAWFSLTRSNGPDEAAGRAWLERFANLLTSPDLLGARGPAALSLFPRLGTWPASGCQTGWRSSDGLGPFVVSQSLELAQQEPDPCDRAQFGELSTVLRQSESVTPGAMADLLTQQFGAPAVHREVGLSGSIAYDWDVLYGVHIRMVEPVRPRGADTFSVVVTRFVGASTAIPSPADGERWLDQAVSLLTGPDLPAARGMQAVKLVDASMVPDPTPGGGCASSFSTGSAAAKEAIAYEKSLTLQDAPSDCANAAFRHLSMTVWQRAPVTVEALVQRLEAKLGQPMLNRDFNLHSLRYEWKTGLGTTVGVSEFIGSADRLFSASVWRD